MFDGCKEKNACLRYKVRYDKPTKKEIFRRLLISSFGPSCYGHTDNCYFLYKSFSELLSNYYEISDYNSKRTYFSNKILKLCNNKEFRRAILRAAFLDEGHCKATTCGKREKLRMTLVSSIRNENLARQLIFLMSLENYKTSLYSARNNLEFTVAILTDSKLNFYLDVISTLPLNHRKRTEAEKVLTKDF